MLKAFLIIGFMFAEEKGRTEGHVYCQDAHATDWTPLGYPCPVMCSSVVEAVKKLKELEYKDWISAYNSPPSAKNLNATELKQEIPVKKESKFKIKPKAMLNEDYPYELPQKKLPEKSSEELDPLPLRNEIEHDSLTPEHLRHVYKLLVNKETGSQLQKAFKLASSKLSRRSQRYPCLTVLKLRHMGYVRTFDCKICPKNGIPEYEKYSRRAHINERAIEEFTKILNRNTADGLFTNDMSKALLTKVLGESTNLEHGKFDVYKILTEVSKMIAEQTEERRWVPRNIVLKPKFCINVYIPGCFCIPGYVEKNGQCVRPTDCFKEPSAVAEYLAHITIE